MAETAVCCSQWWAFTIFIQSSNLFTCARTVYKPCNSPSLLYPMEAVEGLGVLEEEPMGEGMARASGVWLKSSRQMGEWAL